MVDFKANLVTIVIIAGFTILLGFFAYSFSQNIERYGQQTSQEIKTMVNTSTTNVTTSIDRMVDLKQDEVNLLSNLSSILAQERETSKQNLALFLSTFANQSEAEVNATMHLEDAVVETLEQSQNLTRYSQNLTEQRIEVEQQTVDKLDELTQTFNLTLTPNASVVAN